MQWRFDPAHTIVEAAAKHMMLSTVRVSFSGTTGEIELDPDRPESAAVRLSIPVASASSRDERRDAHLRSADFFDAETHPAIEFASRSVQRIGPDRFRVSGDLTIRGTTRPVAVDVALRGVVDDPMVQDAKRAFLDARATIDRREWGLVWNMPIPQGVLVGNDIDIEVSAEVMQVVAEAATKAA